MICGGIIGVKGVCVAMGEGCRNKGSIMVLNNIDFLYSLVVTVLTELPVILLFIKYVYNYETQSISKIAGISVLASSLTLPYLWLLSGVVTHGLYFIVVGELVVTVIEAFIYYKLLRMKFRDSIIISLIANTSSVVSGMLLLGHFL